jgi:hypothetical protein
MQMNKNNFKLIEGGKYAEEKAFADRVINEWHEIRRQLILSLKDNKLSLKSRSNPYDIKDIDEANRHINEKGMHPNYCASIVAARLIARQYGELKARLILSAHFKNFDLKAPIRN